MRSWAVGTSAASSPCTQVSRLHFKQTMFRCRLHAQVAGQTDSREGVGHWTILLRISGWTLQPTIFQLQALSGMSVTVAIVLRALQTGISQLERNSTLPRPSTLTSGRSSSTPPTTPAMVLQTGTFLRRTPLGSLRAQLMTRESWSLRL